MRRLLLGLVLLLSPLGVRAQCDAIVLDDAGVLSSDQVGAIITAAGPLVNQGADLRVRTVGSTDNLDITERRYESQCANWQGGYGGRKNTLIVLMVSPASHKSGIYYGAAWKGALDNHWNRIKTDYMNPKFHDKDWTGGFIATETQLAARLTAAKDETLHPAVSTTVNQASDLTGLWRALIVMVLLGAFGLLCWGIWFLLTRRKKVSESVQAAQQRAVIARNATTDRINRYKEEVTPLTVSRYDLAVESFARLMGSERTNPDTPGLSEEQYDDIASEYYGISRDLDLSIRPVRIGGEVTNPTPPTPKPPHVSGVAGEKVHYDPPKRVTSKRKHRGGVEGSTAAVVGSNPSTSIFAPVIINEETYERPSRRDVEETPSRESESYTSHSSEDNGGGGSSSWGSESSDSGSSGSSDSGGSSDFGGGGGDSGGGGGGDF